MNAVKQSLTRKLGPLPVWAWAAISGGAIFLWRYTHGQYSGGSTSTAASTDTSTTDAATPQDVTTLDPGQSAYDPNTGALVSGAPEQLAPGYTDGPVTLDPGQSVYDPGRGIFGPIKRAAKKVKKKPRTKNVKKAKPHHTQHGKKAAKPHTHGKTKPRGKGAVRHDNPRARTKPGAPKGKRRGSPHPTGKSTPRAPTPAKAPGVVKQRTAATHPAPSANSRAHPKAAPPKPKTAPRAPRRRGK